jgi:hypothetical protein
MPNSFASSSDSDDAAADQSFNALISAESGEEPVPDAATPGHWSSLIGPLLCTLVDISALPIAYSIFNSEPWTLLYVPAVPFCTVAAVLLLLHAGAMGGERLRSMSVMIGVVLLLSFPIGLLLSALLPSWLRPYS